MGTRLRFPKQSRVSKKTLKRDRERIRRTGGGLFKNLGIDVSNYRPPAPKAGPKSHWPPFRVPRGSAADPDQADKPADASPPADVNDAGDIACVLACGGDAVDADVVAADAGDTGDTAGVPACRRDAVDADAIATPRRKIRRKRVMTKRAM